MLVRTMLRWLLKIYQEGDVTASLGNFCQCSVTLKTKKTFPDVQTESPVLQLPLVLSLDSIGKCHPSSLYSFFRYLYKLMVSPQAFSFLRVSSPSSLSLSLQMCLIHFFFQPLHHHHGSTEVQCVHVFCTGETQTGHSTPNVASTVLNRGERSLWMAVQPSGPSVTPSSFVSLAIMLRVPLTPPLKS